MLDYGRVPNGNASRFIGLIIYVNREERGRSAAHGDACRAAEALFASWVVEMGAWDVCEAVGTVAVAHRSIVPCRWPRGHFWDRGANFGLDLALLTQQGQKSETLRLGVCQHTNSLGSPPQRPHRTSGAAPAAIAFLQLGNERPILYAEPGQSIY